MATPMRCQVRVKGHFSGQWADWFGGLAIENLPSGEAVLGGFLSDQAVLLGVLKRMHELGLVLMSVSCVQAGQDDMPPAP